MDGYHLASELESCTTEIGVYLSNHANWPQPIFPNVSDCSRLVFVPTRFDAVGSCWNCSDVDDIGNQNVIKQRGNKNVSGRGIIGEMSSHRSK